MDRDNAKARRESGFEDDDDDEEEEEEEDFGFLDEEELVSKKRRLFLRRLGSQFRVNARSEMDIEEEDALTFLCCKRLLIGKGHSSHRRCDVLSTKSTQKRGDNDAFDAMETTIDGNECNDCSWGTIVFIGLDNRYIQQFY